LEIVHDVGGPTYAFSNAVTILQRGGVRLA